MDEEIRPVLVSNSEASELRDKANFTYSTIAITAALLAAVTFSAYITPPAPPAFETTSSDDSAAAVREADITNGLLSAFYGIRTVIVPINFVLNLLATLTACLVMVYVNSSRTSEAELVKLFGDPESEHDVIKVPVSLLFLGIIGTLLGLFVGIPLRYPQLSNLPVLLAMSALIFLLLLFSVFAFACASEDSPVFQCLGQCCSPGFRKVCCTSFLLFFGSGKHAGKRKGDARYWGQGGDKGGYGGGQQGWAEAGYYGDPPGAPGGGGGYGGTAAGGYGGGGAPPGAPPGYYGGGYQYGAQQGGGGPVHASWGGQQQLQAGGPQGGKGGGPQGGCCSVM